MPGNIDKKSVEHLADLARINLSEDEKERLVKDATSILVYFEELSQADTSNVEGIAGATDTMNVVSLDKIDQNIAHKGIESFPESKNNCLKVPGVINNTDE
jgi:aspartyl-tRNA(Asn)/glutamyl-tRNA(Gln) amidotransferase subunit C